VLTIENEGVEA